MATSKATIKARMIKNGWSESEAEWRSDVIAASHACAAGNAVGVPDLHFVGVERRDGRTGVGFCCDGRLQVDGVYLMPGEIRRKTTLPWRRLGGDLWMMQDGDTVAVLGDGTEVKRARLNMGVYEFAAAGRTFGSILDAALALTPAFAAE